MTKIQPLLQLLKPSPHAEGFESPETMLSLADGLRPQASHQRALKDKRHDLEERFRCRLGGLELFLSQVNLARKVVLEVGGALPEPLVLDQLQAQKWTAVNLFSWGSGGKTPPGGCRPLNAASKPVLDQRDYQLFDGRIEDIPQSFDERFDVACSINALEHIHNIWKALERIHRSLKPGGVFIASFGPIWSGNIGHHVWIDSGLNFNTFQLPDYVHLRVSKQECRRIVMNAYGAAVADQFVEKAFFHPVINRLFIEDYVEALHTSLFEYWKISPYGIEQDPEVLRELRAVAGDRIYARGINLIAQKQG